MKIGIVGGSGFIGNHLTRYLSLNSDVKVLDVKPASIRLVRNASFETCDIRHYDNLCGSLSDVDFVIHAAIIQIPQINENKKLAYEVNVIGTQNVCKAVSELPNIRGMILTSSWHTIGEHELSGVVNEEFGFRPDKVEDRARLYAISKMAQEAIVRFYSEMSGKLFGIIRMGTVLGEDMPDKTAAQTFIDKGIKGELLTPFRHSMYRPMLYVDINDVCRAYSCYIENVLNGKIIKSANSLHSIVNVCYHEPVTILELAEMVRTSIISNSRGQIQPKISIVDKGIPPLFSSEDKTKIRVDIGKAKDLLGIDSLIAPKESIDRIVRSKLKERS